MRLSQTAIIILIVAILALLAGLAYMTISNQSLENKVTVLETKRMELEKEITELDQSFKALTKRYSDQGDSLSSSREQLIKLNDQLKSAQRNIYALQQTNQITKEEAAKYRKRLETYENKLRDMMIAAGFFDEKQIDPKKELLDPFANSFNELLVKNKDLQKKLSAIEENNKTLSSEKEQLMAERDQVSKELETERAKRYLQAVDFVVYRGKGKEWVVLTKNSGNLFSGADNFRVVFDVRDQKGKRGYMPNQTAVLSCPNETATTELPVKSSPDGKLFVEINKKIRERCKLVIRHEDKEIGELIL
jgi:Tfp pilus assembly protein PilE